uniref:Large ribosomal subunit protein bL12 C-terminal domain-containing protein n=1 Tax=Opuntia streptacantha TaxID=393608 RepID=A0A7C9CEX6_OPUST
MHLAKILRRIPIRPVSLETTAPLQARYLQTDVAQKTKPRRYKYPPVYDPYGPRPPPSEKVTQLAETIAALTPEERAQIGPALRERLNHPKLEKISTEGLDLGAQAGGASAGGAPQAEEKKAEKIAFDVKLEKFEAAAKIKVIKEVRAFTNLGLKEAKDLVEKVPVVLKQGVTKEEAAEIITKIQAAGGVAVME